LAQYQKKTNKTAASSAKKNSNKKSSAKKPAEKRVASNTRNREISGIIIIAIGILLLVSVLLASDGSTSGLGAVGGFFADAMRLLAGQAAIVFPIFLLTFGGLVFADRYTGMLNGRLFGLSVVLLAILGLLHLKLEFLPWTEYIKAAALGTGGGVIGAVFAFLLQTAFGRILSTIIFVFALLIGLLLVTRISLKTVCSAVFASVCNFFSGLRPDDEEVAEMQRLKEAQRKEEKLKIPAKKDITKEPKHNVLHNEPEVPARTPRIFISDDIAGNIFSPALEAGAAPLTPEKNAFAKEFLPDITTQNDLKEQPAEEPVKETLKEAVPELAEGEEVIYSNPAAAEIPVEATPEETLSEPAAKEYILPQPELISMPVNIKNPRMDKAITDSVSLLEETLNNFGVKATVTQVVAGPSVTRYELQPAPGIKVSRIVGLTDDIALALAAPDVRIEAPIPGRSVVGIEVPRDESITVHFREVIESDAFSNAKSKISFALGKDIAGNYIVGDLAKMPHLLVAGATGTGKSVCINSFICSILFKAKPDEVKFLLIDPKKVELSTYAGLPHLNSPVVTDVKKAAGCLKWVVSEMENRYDIFSGEGVRNFTEYNNKFPEKPLCHIVVIIDELADLMMTAKDDVEQSICRLAQMARAAGIHLVIATQRPSVDVLTGLIKANIPSRIAFAVSSGVDSRTILDMHGAERLIGKGDMLYSPIGQSKPTRVQGTFISDKDVEQLVLYCKAQAKPQYCETAAAAMEAAVNDTGKASVSHERTADDKDPLFYEAARLIITTGQASTSYLQRRFSIGNPRAGRLIDCLADNGVVSGPDGSKPRNILMTLDQFEEKFGGVSQ